MNKLLVIAAVAALATTANAAPAKKMAKQSMKQTATASQANAKAADKATAASQTPPALNPAVGSNVLNSEQQIKKPAKTWGVAFVSEMTVAANEANNNEMKDKNVGTENYVGLTYQATPAIKFGLRQNFSAKHVAKSADGKTPADNVVTMNDVAVTASYKAGKIGSSEPITPTLYYYAPTSDASQAVSSNGKVRLDGEIDYVLTPKWTVGYYASGRQSFIPASTTKAADGTETENFSKSQLLHFGVLYYNFTDKVQAYAYGGAKHTWRSSTATLDGEATEGGLGTSFTMFDGKFVLNPELSLEQVTVDKSIDKSGGALLAEANLTYYLLASVTF